MTILGVGGEGVALKMVEGSPNRWRRGWVLRKNSDIKDTMAVFPGLPELKILVFSSF